MPEEREKYLRALPSLENESLKQPLALEAAIELAARLNLSEEARAVLFGTLDALDEEHAELAWHTIGDMNELFDMLGIDMSGD